MSFRRLAKLSIGKKEDDSVISIDDGATTITNSNTATTAATTTPTTTTTTTTTTAAATPSQDRSQKKDSLTILANQRLLQQHSRSLRRKMASVGLTLASIKPHLVIDEHQDGCESDSQDDCQTEYEGEYDGEYPMQKQLNRGGLGHESLASVASERSVRFAPSEEIFNNNSDDDDVVFCNRKTSSSTAASIFSQQGPPRFRSGSTLTDESQERPHRSFRDLAKLAVRPKTSCSTPSMLSITELLQRTQMLSTLAVPIQAEALSLTYENPHTRSNPLSPITSTHGSQLHLPPTPISGASARRSMLIDPNDPKDGSTDSQNSFSSPSAKDSSQLSASQLREMRMRRQRRRKGKNGRKAKKLMKAETCFMKTEMSGGGGGRIPLIGGTLKDLAQHRIKGRHDSADDQFSRILMVRSLLLCALLCSMQYYYDKVRCISPLDKGLNMDFVRSACWIDGMYIYAELMERWSETDYYGIPRDIGMDGINNQGKLCRMVNKATDLIDENCRALTKSYFTHYQFFPFYVASLSVIYYFPYIVFRLLNHDLVRLKANILEPNAVDAESVLDNFFDYDENGGVHTLRGRVLGTIAVKFLYLAVNVAGFLFTDLLFKRKFVYYGFDWFRWYKINSTRPSPVTGSRVYEKPGNFLLPTMAYCDFFESTSHVVETTWNKHKLICEISAHTNYQYLLMVLWFLFVSSCTVSTLGFLHHLTNFSLMSLNFLMWNRRKTDPFYRTCKSMTVREIEYLKLIRRHNFQLYRDVLDLLEREILIGKYEANTLFQDAENVLSNELADELDSMLDSQFLIDTYF